jgi:hypothetical protein
LYTNTPLHYLIELSDENRMAPLVLGRARFLMANHEAFSMIPVHIHTPRIRVGVLGSRQSSPELHFMTMKHQKGYRIVKLIAIAPESNIILIVLMFVGKDKSNPRGLANEIPCWAKESELPRQFVQEFHNHAAPSRHEVLG